MFCVALTFDDGFVEQLKYARLLYKMNVQGTFFLITGLRKYRGRNLMINEARAVRELVDMGHEAGSHAHTHSDLTKLSLNELEDEFRLSRIIIEELTGEDNIGIAYPYGPFNRQVIEVASKHFTYGRTMGSFNRWNGEPNRYALGGMGVRHLVKLPIKLARSVKLVTVVFHDEPTWIIRLTIDYLRGLNARFVTMREGLKCLGF